MSKIYHRKNLDQTLWTAEIGFLPQRVQRMMKIRWYHYKNQTRPKTVQTTLTVVQLYTK